MDDCTSQVEVLLPGIVGNRGESRPTCRRSRLRRGSAERHGYQLHRGGDPHFAEDLAAVAFGRAHAHAQRQRDFLRRLAGDQEIHHLAFARRQTGEALGHFRSRRNLFTTTAIDLDGLADALEQSFRRHGLA